MGVRNFSGAVEAPDGEGAGDLPYSIARLHGADRELDLELFEGRSHLRSHRPRRRIELEGQDEVSQAVQQQSGVGVWLGNEPTP